jgi:hypothetical protein
LSNFLKDGDQKSREYSFVFFSVSKKRCYEKLKIGTQNFDVLF